MLNAKNAAYMSANRCYVVLFKQRERLYITLLTRSNQDSQGHTMMKREENQFLLQTLVRDLLESNAFSLPALAREIGVPSENISNLFLKNHTDSSYTLAMAIIQLHRETFPQFYDGF